MADFNKRLMDLQKKSKDMQINLLSLLREHDGLYREANTIYLNQRLASGDEGLADFHRLLLLVRRNRDIIGSLNQGAKNIRPMDQFKFIEEDIPIQKKETPAQIRRNRKNQEQPASVAPVELGDIEAPVEELEVTNG